MKLHSAPTNRHGWSLIELMVIFAVLAVLLSILFPVMGRGREGSYRIQCASNMKQLASAFMLYAGDWGGYWPGPGCMRGDYTYWTQNGGGGLNGYIRQRGVGSVWCCPLQTTWDGDYSARTYTMNGYLRTRPDVEFPKCKTILCGVNTCAIQLPSKTVLLYEGALQLKASATSVDYVYRCANWSYVRGFTGDTNHPEMGIPWHGKLNNYTYCDGHVVARRPGRAIGDLSTGGEMYQWYVNKSEWLKNTYNTPLYRRIPWE